MNFMKFLNKVLPDSDSISVDLLRPRIVPLFMKYSGIIETTKLVHGEILKLAQGRLLLKTTSSIGIFALQSFERFFAWEKPLCRIVRSS